MKLLFCYHTEVVVIFSLTFSDEVVTAAQHLYEMVSFYFDDLGKLLLVDVSFWFSLYRVSFSFVCLI